MSLYGNQYLIKIKYINDVSKNHIIFEKNMHQIYDLFQNILDNVSIIHIVKFFNKNFEDYSFGCKESIINNSEREKLFKWISNQYKKI